MYAELNITEKELDVIKNLIFQNPYYAGNEDLLPQICEAVYRKSHLLFKSVQNYEYLESYLKKIVNNCIIDILQSRTRTGSLRLQKSKYTDRDVEKKSPSDSSSLIENTGLKFKKAYEIYKIDDPCTENDVYAPERRSMEKILELLEVVNSENSGKNYLQIFVERYIENKSSEMIAFDLGLSESEVNRRLLNLADIIEENL